MGQTENASHGGDLSISTPQIQDAKNVKFRDDESFSKHSCTKQ